MYLNNGGLCFTNFHAVQNNCSERLKHNWCHFEGTLQS
jgi:hypothetical protein